MRTLYPRAIGVPWYLTAVLVVLVSELLALVQRALWGRALIEPILIALFIGICVTFLFRNHLGPQSLTFARWGNRAINGGLASVGLGLSGGTLAQLRLSVMLLLVAVVAMVMLVAWLVSRFVGVNDRLGMLIGVGNAICGNSAIAATGPALRASQTEIALAITSTAVVGLLLSFGFPAVVSMLELSQYQAGVAAGTLVYSVPQVVAVGFQVGPEAGEIATVTKMARILLLIPVVVLIGIVGTKRAPGIRQPRNLLTYVPTTIAVFGLGLTIGIIGIVPDAWAPSIDAIGSVLFVLGMAMVGMLVDLKSLGDVGAKIMAPIGASLLIGGMICVLWAIV